MEKLLTSVCYSITTFQRNKLPDRFYNSIPTEMHIYFQIKVSILLAIIPSTQ